LSGSGIESYIKQKRDEALPLGESMTPEAQPVSFAVGGSSQNASLLFRQLIKLKN